MLGRWASSRSSLSRRQERRTERQTWKWTNGQKKKRNLRELQALLWSLFGDLGGTSRMRGLRAAWAVHQVYFRRGTPAACRGSYYQRYLPPNYNSL